MLILILLQRNFPSPELPLNDLVMPLLALSTEIAQFKIYQRFIALRTKIFNLRELCFCLILTLRQKQFSKTQ